MKNKQLGHLIVVVLMLVGLATETATVNASSSGTVSTTTAQFYGKKDTTNNGDNSNNSNSGVGNKILPQTGDFVMPGTSLLGYILLISGILLMIFKSQKKTESNLGGQ
ncbi:hypothetical protein RD055328_12330 [Companilactobacillus sp. RD055328]|uniref:LPXTG cell wall anchor domain-containing protein n=1 Tax=Companilactobacillus sp. RD055328 TaxID=2916634 RepID=UPI001FC84762|nr:LPXTG cell wall anchor domain-containing protein [Companilactobacillus sp. RD055328]GKQ43310.1 hypothetical protein RD055328_12330 [Companilactobacillus sp. RD055328]